MAYNMEDAYPEQLSGEHNLSDDDHCVDDEVEALQHLPPEERRKALRRLRNRESARRVRARRLAEMSHMEIQLKGVQDENDTLKSHVAQLQGHIQAMTVKIYEVTAKYEAAVAENVRLKAELQGSSTLVPVLPAQVPMLGEAAFAAHTVQHAMLAQQHQQAAAQQAAKEASAVHGLSAAHASLRSSTPNNMSDQRHAIDEVVLLLQEHRRRNEITKERNCASEHASSVHNGPMNNLTTSSPLSDGPGAMPMRPGRSSFDMPARSSFDVPARSSFDVPAAPSSGSAGLMQPFSLLQHQQQAQQQQVQQGPNSAPLPNQFPSSLVQQPQQPLATVHSSSLYSNTNAITAPFFTANSLQNALLACNNGAGVGQQSNVRSSSFAMDHATAMKQQQVAAGQAAAAAAAGLSGHMTWPGMFALNGNNNPGIKDDVFMDFDELTSLPQDL